MKGLIFNIVEEIITELYDADTWDDLLDAAEVDGAYTALGNYDDEQLLAIVAAASSATGIEVDDLWRTVGRRALPKLAARLPGIEEKTGDSLTFLLAVNDIIHPEVRMLYPKAAPPVFEFTETDDGLVVRYRSARRLDALAEGLMTGCGDLFGETVGVETMAGDTAPDEALFRVRFGGGAA